MDLSELDSTYLQALKLRIESKYKVTETGCWEWTAGRNSKGYGQISISHRGAKYKYGAHRVYYQLIKGFIAQYPAIVIDHEICSNPPCINPDHLKAVTIWENTLRSDNPVAKNPFKTHCPKGHQYTEENTLLVKNKYGLERRCRVCVNAKSHRRDLERTLEYHKRGLNSKGKPLRREIDYRFS